MKVTKIEMICSPRELDIILNSPSALMYGVVIEQWADEPMQYKIAISKSLYDFLMNSNKNVFIS